MKLEFTRADFDIPIVSTGQTKFITDVANKRLSEMLKEAPEVFLKLKNIDGGLTKNKYYCATQIGNNGETHKALLINIEEIVKEPCKHQSIPHFFLVRPDGDGYDGFKCKHCGVELVATWSEA